MNDSNLQTTGGASIIGMAETKAALPMALTPDPILPTAKTRRGEEVIGERLLTPKELCARLQVSRSTGWKLTATGGLRCIRVGRSVRIRECDLEEWLEQNATDGNGEGATV